MSSYLLLSLPTSIVPSGHNDDAFEAIQALGSDARLQPFHVPNFKIGTLDTLVLQADELAKLDSACEQAVGKTADVIRSIFEGNEQRVKENKLVNDKPVDTYLTSFTWNKQKYRSDRPIPDLVSVLKSEITSLDDDIKSKYASYQSQRTTFQSLQKRSQGNLSTKSLATVLKPEHFLDSEYLTTALLAIPKVEVKEFLQNYEKLVEMIVPRSAFLIAQDDEFCLYGVVVFKKHYTELSHKAREKRYIPREATYNPAASKTEASETKSAEEATEKLWGETLRLGRTAYSDLVSAWVHVKTLRVFVESVLRYGLPLDFVAGVFIGKHKSIDRTKENLESKYAFLGGNAYGKDKKGKIVRKDDANVAEFTAGGAEYTPFVEYIFEVA